MGHNVHARTGQSNRVQQLKRVPGKLGVGRVLGHAGCYCRVQAFGCLHRAPVLGTCNPRTERGSRSEARRALQRVAPPDALLFAMMDSTRTGACGVTDVPVLTRAACTKAWNTLGTAPRVLAYVERNASPLPARETPRHMSGHAAARQLGQTPTYRGVREVHCRAPCTLLLAHVPPWRAGGARRRWCGMHSELLQ